MFVCLLVGKQIADFLMTAFDSHASSCQLRCRSFVFNTGRSLKLKLFELVLKNLNNEKTHSANEAIYVSGNQRIAYTSCHLNKPPYGFRD